MEHIRRRVHEVLQLPSRSGDRWGRTFDSFIVTLILANVLAVVIGTVPHIERQYGAKLYAFELFSIAVFGIEYVARIWSVTTAPEFRHPVTGRLRFMVTPMAIVDVLAILPALVFFLDLRVLRVLRLARILKLTRYSTAWHTLARVVRERADSLIASFVIIGLSLLVTSSLMYYAENAAQPGAFTSIPDAMWWGIAALTTTGYGDIVPVTAAGRLLGAATAFLGIAVVALPSAILAAGYIDALAALRAEAARPQACPHCGRHAAEAVAGRGASDAR